MNPIKQIILFLKEDSWQSWMLSLLLVIIVIKLILFPLASLITGSPLPLVVIESCSMYHSSYFESWWNENKNWYESHNISKQDFEDFPFNNGLNKGDVILLLGRAE